MRLFYTTAAAALPLFFSTALQAAEMRPIPLQSRITGVQPMTGMVLWTDNSQAKTKASQLEYSYVRYSDIVKEKDRYDWSFVEDLLTVVSSRQHQAILRFYFDYPGRPSAAPEYLRKLPDYRETQGPSEGKKTWFADWSHPELHRFTLDFYQQFAAKYDRDPRLAFVQTGFGLWAEYHIYSGPMKLGKTFPDHAFQEKFVRHLSTVLKHTPWMISVDAANHEHTPFAKDPTLLALPFGVMDDSFLCKQHAEENEKNWNALDRSRWQRAVTGGELSYYSKHDQKEALATKGPHGIPFEKAAGAFHLTFMIGNDQLEYRSEDRLRSAGMACGYRFRITRFVSGKEGSEVTVENSGVAPIYHDAFVTVDQTRSTQSLKGLLPGKSRLFKIAAGSDKPDLTIESDRLVRGQRIEFEAALE